MHNISSVNIEDRNGKRADHGNISSSIVLMRIARIIKFFPVHLFETALKLRVKICFVEAEERRDTNKELIC